MDLTLKQLALAVYKKDVPTNFSHSDMQGALREKFRELASDYNTYRRNKLEIFELIQDVVDDVMPQKIRDAIGQFADVRTYDQGSKPRFKVKKGRSNVKRFITRIGLGGVYERVRLDSDFVDVNVYGYGGAVYIELEQFLDGTMDWNELIDLIIEGIEDKVYQDIQTALINTYSSLPTNNKYSDTSFVVDEMVNILATVRAYGNATIFCTPEFAATISPTSSFVGDADKADFREMGYVGKFAGANVIVLPQSFEDETNTTKIFNPQYAFIIPTGGSADEKPIKVAFEGQTVIKEVENADDSMEFKAYKKLGTTSLNTNHFGIYRNTAL